MKLTKLLLLLLLPQIVYPCSSFVLKNERSIFLGKNFDWTFDKGHLIKNLRYVTKVAYYTHNGQPATWTSKYECSGWAYKSCNHRS